MAGVLLGRENTLGRVIHPELLKGPDAHRVLIEDPMVDPITKGDGLLGWEGDPRYALYVNNKAGRWELWRREQDDVYRMSIAVPGFISGADIVPWLVTWLIEHDGRRGFDPVASVLADNAALEADKAAKADAQFEEAADRLHHALLKDVGHLEGGLSRRQF